MTTPPRPEINVAVGDAPAAHDRVERALMMPWNGCSRSRGTGAQHPWNAQSKGRERIPSAPFAVSATPSTRPLEAKGATVRNAPQLSVLRQRTLSWRHRRSNDHRNGWYPYCDLHRRIRNGRLTAVPTGRCAQTSFSSWSRGRGSSGYRRLGMPAFSARSLARDGVSWDRAARLKTQSAGDAAGYKIHAVVCSLPRASLLAGARCGLLSQWSVEAYAAMNAVPSRSMACIMMARRRARATRALRMLDRLAMAKAQSLSLSWPL